ncbi:hypothetical protein H1P_5680001 [Hyella patelloides LEGE 07179]|uniref:DUF3987 domain-containing protein n=1 Tax=Hyella patelloides LEGE 07179 TaxID=945734 RepID=A0A563W0I3_9CYAN|nr:DUF3987 domain-containing protein [Hyella patelloides]VEP17199.1 hypothetical protein H1P_5680001 [Hyella patelloides LEGE 07179]
MAKHLRLIQQTLARVANKESIVEALDKLDITQTEFKEVNSYRLNEALSHASGKCIFVVEGEKSIEACRSVGLVASDISSLSKSPQCLDSVKEKDITIVIIPDKDEAGIKKATDLEQACLEHQVKYLILDVYQWLKDKPDKYDFADYISDLNMNADEIIKVLNYQIKQAMETRVVDKPVDKAASQDIPQDSHVEATQIEDREIAKEKIDSLLELENYEPDLKDYLQPSPAQPLQKIASYLGMRPVSLLTILLSVSASLLFNDVNKLVLIKACEFEALPIIYTAICAPSGSGKSPAFKVLTNPLIEMQIEEEERYKIAHQEWEDTDYEERGDEPTVREYYANDATTESIAKIQGDQPDKGLLRANAS